MEAHQEKKNPAHVTLASRIKVEKQQQNLQTKELRDIHLGLMEPISKDRRSTDPNAAEERSINTGS